MKKWKLYAAITVLVIMTGLLSFAVYAATHPTTGVANRTEFITGDENVFVNISAVYEGPDSITPNAEKTYTLLLDKDNEDSYDDLQVSNKVWNVGRTNFVQNQHETIAFIYTVKNLNTSNDLELIFSQVAVDYVQRFSTTVYVYDVGTIPTEDHATSLYVPDESTKTANSNPIVIGKGEVKVIKIEFKLQSYAEDFEFANHIKVYLKSVQPTEDQQ